MSKSARWVCPSMNASSQKWVSPQCKINPGKCVSGINCHLTKSSAMSGLCPSVSISESNINERSTTNHTSSDQNESPLLEVIMVMWRKYLTSSKEIACLNVKKIKQGGYASTKMHPDMIMPRCKLVSLKPNANERVMPQYRANSEMTKLHCKLS